MTTPRKPIATKPEQCSRCFGRGYIPEQRRPSARNPHGNGFYARTCPGCAGRGERIPPRHPWRRKPTNSSEGESTNGR